MASWPAPQALQPWDSTSTLIEWRLLNRAWNARALCSAIKTAMCEIQA